MNYFHLSAKLLSPLLIQKKRQSNVASGISYIPGSTLRGAIAENYIRNLGDPEDPAFQKLFLNEAVTFPNLYPAEDGVSNSVPLPLTAYSCKQNAGFLNQNDDAEKECHGVVDMLPHLIARGITGNNAQDAFNCSYTKQNGRCSFDLKPFSGFWNGDIQNPKKTEPDFRHQVHTGIDRETGTVAEKILYSNEAIAAIKSVDNKLQSQYFSSTLFLDDEQHLSLSACIEENVFAGADRSSGMGEMKLELAPGQNPTFDLLNWNKAFKNRLSKIGMETKPSELYFTINLISDAILLDKFLRPTDRFELEFPDIEPVRRVLKQNNIRGWQSSWRLPKPEDVAVSMGSVLLYRYTGDKPDELEEYLKQLARQGLGVRKSEGFGRIQICDPIHVKEVI